MALLLGEKQMKKHLSYTFCMLSIIFCIFQPFIHKASAEDPLAFPLRTKYKHLKVIDTQKLASIFDNAILVDARNKMEFNVIRIVDAHNIPAGTMSEGNLLALRKKDGKKPIIFYCNGTT